MGLSRQTFPLLPAFAPVFSTLLTLFSISSVAQPWPCNLRSMTRSAMISCCLASPTAWKIRLKSPFPEWTALNLLKAFLKYWLLRAVKLSLASLVFRVLTGDQFTASNVNNKPVTSRTLQARTVAVNPSPMITFVGLL